MLKDAIPPYHAFMNPVLKALKDLGGSGTNDEINAKVIEDVGLTYDQLDIPHNPDKGAQTEVEYRLHWARTYLKKFGVLVACLAFTLYFSASGIRALYPQIRYGICAPQWSDGLTKA